MDEKAAQRYIQSAATLEIERILDTMTPGEMAAINICLLLDQNPQGWDGWDKVAHLFTRQSPSGYPAMDENVRAVWDRLANAKIMAAAGK